MSEAHTDHIHVYLGGGDQDFSAIDNSPLKGSDGEEYELNREELHNELNNNEMLSELTSRTGQVATRLEQQMALVDVMTSRTGMVATKMDKVADLLEQLLDAVKASR